MKRGIAIAFAVVVGGIAWPARAEEVRVPVTRDTWVSAVGEEATANLGGAPRLKLKSIQEMTLVDIDPAPLRGRVITKATLHLRLADKERLRRVTVSTVSAEWEEGTSPSYTPGAPGASFRFRKNPDVPWSYPDSDLTSVVLGQGSSLWRMADATDPDADGWQSIPVEPSVVAARVAALSYGFLVFDDTGSEWTYDGTKYEHRLFPNRFIYSREAGEDKAPYFTVELGAEDRQPPKLLPDALEETAGLGLVSIRCARDDEPGSGRALGFRVNVDGKPVPPWMVPLSWEPGMIVGFDLADLQLTPETRAQVEVAAVDGAGNVGPAKSIELTIPKPAPEEPLPPVRLTPFTEAQLQPPVALGKTGQLFVIDELDTYTATGAKRTGPRPELYNMANHLWHARSKRIRLQAARNEFVAFQVVIQGSDPALDEARARVVFPGAAARGISAEVGRYVEVPTADGAWVGDPIVPLDRMPSWPKVAGRTQRSLHIELYVPHDTRPGPHDGMLQIESGGATTELSLSLTVLGIALPDRLSFLPEMNCYDLPANERDYYLLAHKHRTFLNRVPYHQDGRVAEGCAPKWDGKNLDWTEWDKRFGPLFDGSAFADLPRKGVPIEGFYIPIHENWPTPIEGNYNGNYWADLAFTPEYRAALVNVSRQFTLHLDEKGWDKTLFQAFLNGKNDFKKNGWSRGTSPWLLDEPANFQDFWALRWFGLALGEGLLQARRRAPSQVQATARLLYRADISRPEWQRDALDGLIGYEVVSNDAFRHYGRLIRDRKRHLGQVVMEYGAANPIGTSNVQAVGWSLDAWSRGADGVLPWQTIGTSNSWTTADDLSLFYPGRKSGDPPVPSIRLKAFRRGQQDVEYLQAYCGSELHRRDALQSAVRSALELQGRREGTGSGGEDAGRLAYDRLDPIGLWTLRSRVAAALPPQGHPTIGAADRSTGLPPIAKDRQPIPGYGDVSGETPLGQSGFIGPATRAEPTSRPAGVAGPGVTLPLEADALIDPARPDESLGGVGRENALVKNQSVSAFLLQFDTTPLRPLDRGKLVSATLRIYIWDPSSQGRTKVEARSVQTPWEPKATWNQPGTGRWKAGAFDPAQDAPTAAGSTIIEPDVPGSDTPDPPVEVAFDVTDVVKMWLENPAANAGIALVPVPDRAVDEGHYTRMQLYGSEERSGRYGPRLTVTLRP